MAGAEAATQAAQNQEHEGELIMGMDVYGHKPRSETGTYFRANVWHWHPLANLMQVIGGDVAAKCANWHTNVGDGLDAADSHQLAVMIEQALKSGEVAAYVEEHENHLANLPDEECLDCNGSGTRTDLPGGPQHCDNCEGAERHRPFDAFYVLDIETVRAFAAFLAACGGFAICWPDHLSSQERPLGSARRADLGRMAECSHAMPTR